MIQVQKGFDDKILEKVRELTITYLKKTGGFEVPLLGHEAEPLSMVLGALHMK